MLRSQCTAATCAVAALFTSLLSAQDINISNANVQFSVEFNSTRMVYNGVADFFQADPGGDPAGVLFKTAWAYRLDGDTQEFILTDTGATFNSAGSVGTATWSDVDGRGLISAVATYTAIPTSATSGEVSCHMEITNISAADVTLNLFHLADVDLCGAAFNMNTTTPGSNGRQAVTSTCTELAEHFGAGANRWEVGSYTDVPPGSGNIDLYTQLEDTAITNLRNDAVPFGPYDIRGAFQWQDRVLHPGQTETYVIALGHNTPPCPTSINVFGSSVGGSLGPPTLSSSNGGGPNAGSNPLVGQNFHIRLDNAPRGSLSVLVIGLEIDHVTFGDLTMHVRQGATLFRSVPGSGTWRHTLAIPAGTFLCGLPLVAEGIILDDATSTSTTGLPITHTRGWIWTVGAY